MSIGSILAGVDTFVNAEIQKGEADIAAWWTGFEPVVESDFEKFVAAMQPIALALVEGLVNTALSGTAKLSTASTALLSVAKSQGVAATQTMAVQLVQQIVTSLSAAKPPATT